MATMIAAIIPIKRLDTAKRRLSELLSPSERKRLCQAMLSDVLDVLLAENKVAKIYIVTPDAELKAFIGKNHCSDTINIIQESKQTTLNDALLFARSQVTRNGITHLCFMPGDIPLMTGTEVKTLLELSSGFGPLKAAEAVVVPDKTNNGTNFLFLRPPSILDPCFGPHSFQEHLRRLERKGVPYTVQYCFGISKDIDTPDDLRDFYQYGSGTRSYRVLRDMDIINRLNR